MASIKTLERFRGTGHRKHIEVVEHKPPTEHVTPEDIVSNDELGRQVCVCPAGQPPPHWLALTKKSATRSSSRHPNYRTAGSSPDTPGSPHATCGSASRVEPDDEGRNVRAQRPQGERRAPTPSRATRAALRIRVIPPTVSRAGLPFGGWRVLRVSSSRSFTSPTLLRLQTRPGSRSGRTSTVVNSFSVSCVSVRAGPARLDLAIVQTGTSPVDQFQRSPS